MSENFDLEQVRRIALAIIISPRKDFEDLKRLDPKTYQRVRHELNTAKNTVESNLDIFRCALERLNTCED